MSKHSRALDTRSHGHQMLFRDAARKTITALGREGLNADILLSHALSEIDENGRWRIRDIGANDVAVIIGNKAYLVEDGEA